MCVLILSQYYDPEPVPKAGELARELRDRGHDVEVITGFPNYPSGDPYDGYRFSLMEHSTVDGILVRRTYEYPYHGTSAIKQLIYDVQDIRPESAVLSGMLRPGSWCG